MNQHSTTTTAPITIPPTDWDDKNFAHAFDSWDMTALALCGARRTGEGLYPYPHPFKPHCPICMALLKSNL